MLGNAQLLASTSVLTVLTLGLAAPGVACAPVHAGTFHHPTRIGNRWLPLRPGTEYVYTGTERVSSRTVSHQVVFIVTNVEKKINGVRTRVVWDRDYDSGRLIEGELAFQAQDDAGNVWLLGEYPEEHSGNRVTGAPDTWIAGISHATRGILMPARPRTGTPSYLQGRAPAIGFADRARVRRIDKRNCVPRGCYSHVLVIEEWSPDEPNARQYKHYAAGVGNIRVGFSGGSQREDLVLRQLVHLSHRQLESVDRQVLAIDRRAYRISKHVYGLTPLAVAR